MNSYQLFIHDEATLSEEKDSSGRMCKGPRGKELAWKGGAKRCREGEGHDSSSGGRRVTKGAGRGRGMAREVRERG